MFKLYKNVKFGKNVKIEEFAILGKPPTGKKDGELETIIGDNSLIRAQSIIYAGVKIGNNFQSGDGAKIRENNVIGNNVIIGTNSVVLQDSKIEDNVRIHTNVFIPERTHIQEGSWIGPNVVIINTPHPLCPKAKECMKGPIIGKNVKIGANSTILSHIKIEDNVLIGAGSVVTEDVSKNSVVVGNPARVIKSVDELKCPFKLVKKPYL